jgi:hypothetical protein
MQQYVPCTDIRAYLTVEHCTRMSGTTVTKIQHGQLHRLPQYGVTILSTTEYQSILQHIIPCGSSK